MALAIAAMSVTRSLHPPGGAAALTGVIGGSLVDSAGWWFPLGPVALDAVLLVAVGWAFHRFASGHPYPHRPHPEAAAAPIDFSDAEIDAVATRMGETLDIDRDDLRLILAELEQGVARRR